eukprot:2929222-Ditylum_brightwellii.AAC.1
MQRLDVLRKTNDGAKVALADFMLRGPGELLGLKQSGIKNGYTIDLDAHWGMIAAASQIGRSFLVQWNTPPKSNNVKERVDTSDRGGIDLGGSEEGRRLEKLYTSYQHEFSFSSTEASAMSGFALWVCLSLFGRWSNLAPDEGGTGKSLATLQSLRVDRNKEKRLSSDIEKKFLSLAESFGDVTVKSIPHNDTVFSEDQHQPSSSYIISKDKVPFSSPLVEKIHIDNN